MYNSAPAISLVLTEASTEKGEEKGGWGRILYTRDLGARHISMKTQQDRQRGRVKPSKGQTEQPRLTTLLFNVNEQRWSPEFAGAKSCVRRLWGNTTRHLESQHQKRGRGEPWHKTSWKGLRAASCAKHSNSQRKERAGKIAGLIRQSLGGHWRAHVGKESRGCGMDCEGPPHAT